MLSSAGCFPSSTVSMKPLFSGETKAEALPQPPSYPTAYAPHDFVNKPLPCYTISLILQISYLSLPSSAMPALETSPSGWQGEHHHHHLREQNGAAQLSTPSSALKGRWGNAQGFRSLPRVAALFCNHGLFRKAGQINLIACTKYCKNFATCC